MVSSSPRRVDKRVVAAGALAGAAVAIAASRRRTDSSRVGEQIAGPQVSTASTALIDWERARTIAISMNRGQTLTASERSRTSAYYQSLVERCIPIVEDYTGDTLPPTAARTFAFDRVDWINANIEAFTHVFEPIEDLLATGAQGSEFARGLNRQAATWEVGLLLGYMARRVLGQYDLALIGQDPSEAGKLYYVEPNIQLVERSLGMPRDDFRMWLALHETTHAFEFEAHAWVRGYFNELLSDYLAAFKDDTEMLRSGLSGVRTVVGRLRSRAGDESWLEALMTPAQRATFDRMQALMCMIEGYSNHVMNAVGRELLPTYELIAKRFSERQERTTTAQELLTRLTGLNLKMEQYRLGEEFIARVVGERGPEFARRIWEGPESLPTMEEIKNPTLWFARLDQRGDSGTGAGVPEVEIVEIRHWEA